MTKAEIMEVIEAIEDRCCEPECFRLDQDKNECNMCKVAWLKLDILDMRKD